MICKVSNEVQESWTRILETIEPDEDNTKDCIIISKALGYTDKEISEALELNIEENEETED